jgi:RimJ/RimL family protein N-acetyltransferase
LFEESESRQDDAKALCYIFNMSPGKVVFEGKTGKGLRVLIRYPNQKDLSELHRYINELSQELTFIRYQGEKISLGDEEKYFKAFFEQLKNSKCVKLLVFHKDQLIGVSDITLREFAMSHLGVFGITVAKDFRDKGVGKLLMKLVLEEAEKNLKGLRIIRLGIFANNPIAKELYAEFGFKECGRLPEVFHHKGSYIDEIIMYKKVKNDTIN